MKWDGEWHITYEVFRDMGIAFAVVMVLIYVLVVGWFKSFITPLIIMVPIPLTLIGILPAHGIFGVFFTATSMIGFIALAGIIVRNSILLVDFINLELEAGETLEDAVVKAGAVRLVPIVLTQLSPIVGASFMLSDPIFQGLALALISGVVVVDRADPGRDPGALLHVPEDGRSRECRRDRLSRNCHATESSDSCADRPPRRLPRRRCTVAGRTPGI